MHGNAKHALDPPVTLEEFQAAIRARHRAAESETSTTLDRSPPWTSSEPLSSTIFWSIGSLSLSIHFAVHLLVWVCMSDLI